MPSTALKPPNASSASAVPSDPALPAVVPDIARFQAVTFDFFGTLVDVDRGGRIGMAGVLARLGWADAEARAEALYQAWDEACVRLYRGGAYRRYRAVAADALAGILPDVPPADLPALTEILLAGLVEAAPAHGEVPAVIDALRARLPLMPITNMDDDLFRRNPFAGRFTQVTTAEIAGAYKPSERIFQTALARLGLPPSAVLHVSLAPWADIEGAKPLGIAVAWINRGGERLGRWTPRPDWEFPTLEGLGRLFRL